MRHLSKSAINTLVILLISAILVSLSVYAWFYFPSSQNVNLSTADQKELEIHLYKMDLDGLNYRFIEVNPPENSSAISLNHTWSFFQWGEEYLLENEDEQLFALECICETDIFESGKIALALGLNMMCTSDNMNAALHEEIEPYYALLQFVNVSYHIIDTDITSYDITSQAASVQAQNMTGADFTSITLTESGSTTETITYEGNVNYIYVDRYEEDNFGQDVAVDYYTQTIGEVPNTTKRFRSVIIIKITADQQLVSDAMNEYKDIVTGFDYLSELNLVNQLTLTCNLRTVPEKTE